MRQDAWRREAASYPLSGEVLPRYTDVDIWQHMNNSALISIQGEAVHLAVRSVFGARAWRDSQPALACARSETDFLAESYYPEPLAWGAKLLSAVPEGVRVATALFQGGRCVGLHEACLQGWTDGLPAGFSADQREALRTAQVPGAEALVAGQPGRGDDNAPALADFPWRHRLDIRFGDSDARRMASDAWLARCAEQMRITFLNEAYGARTRPRGGMMVVHVSLRWLRRAMPGAQWEIGCGVAQLGERSLTVRGACFEDGRCLATCESVMVAIDRQTRRSAPVPEELRAVLEPWRLRAAPLGLTS